mmetsp:Transcript_8561/g.14221  ORF Transcript_8561/g.14221 Transcript_8561/m.14221 type:complete len:478 (+) Transcript_8561:104-1537(+)|eukprot:CAMPEP_0119013984 /NCGR_PEP_ID=MMETSP1176-20130426/9290_1 /TAXON_ID=265551 /ORGANISM="Synedropsis recta cf, Strain CCMP1620" /LENGTH=477 /DNA_ID=CAMNT_0006967117 /DNA_START=80 /DNA_END=1513 /DNA_ORIENTATION=+
MAPMSVDVDDDDHQSAAARKQQRRSRKASKQRTLVHQTLRSYVSFGYQSTACMGCFLTLYALLMVCILPMLHIISSSSSSSSLLVPQGPLEGAHVPLALLKQGQQDAIAHAATKLRSQFRQLRKGRGVSDESLLNEAIAEYAVMRAQKHDSRRGATLQMERKEAAAAMSADTTTAGVIVLGMHRSGTSMLAGLLVNGIGYNVGGPLIGAAFDNAKGFFERIDVVLQNDEFMQSQRIWWADGVKQYDGEQVYQDYKKGSQRITFQQGERALQFLNDPNHAPWLQKDPRMCITLQTWLHLLDKKPAVVFTYRNPLEVAMSLEKREKNFPLEHGLRLWIIYNMRAIQNSQGLCRVRSSNDKVLANPLQEVQRIADELTNTCHMLPGSTRISQEQVDKFIDPELQHNKKQLALEAELNKKDVRILEDHGNGCQVKDYQSSFDEGSPEKEREVYLYKAAMKIYCDFQSGDAYKSDYQWPDLP